MSWLENHIQHSPRPETIIHLGAGLCSELPHWKITGAKRIVLVEPNPELLAALGADNGGQEHIALIKGAVSSHSGRRMLYMHNFPMFNSLREPTNLYKSLPGLKLEAKTPVEVHGIGVVLEQAGIDSKAENWLVVDTPGEEATILEALEENEQLHNFTRIFLSAGVESLYQDAKPVARILSRLHSAGFCTVGSVDDSDSDWPRYHLHLDRATLKCKKLEEKLAAVTMERDSIKEMLDQQERVHSEQLTEAKIATETLKSSCQTEIDSLREELDKANEASRAKIEALETDLSIALRLQTMRENDLRELQSRYSELRRIKEDQQDLLAQLHQRLSRAAEFLQLNQAEPNDQHIPEELLKALSGENQGSD